ncbi:hypothetical protein [Actinoplanes couchii]|uniref:Uncharacterized protein n=1 Tax=Actinoplanes couchii TaxID=403638 RepID=A0ABQ3XRM1_9ACTN|nr:hypothetical protein [Actinoplanes couchii]MDR6318905.1 hypothetical protein [Actinoplanes couchii]GID61156.1 hypothetical protein Aco03nite_095600 [Actinoplanes couchii]
MSTVRTVIVCSPDDQLLDWFSASEILEDLHLPSGSPDTMFPVRRRRIIGWFTRWSARHLIGATRRCGAVVQAAGGRRSRLDATTAIKAANAAALTRWNMWQLVVRGTAPARPWAEMLTHAEQTARAAKRGRSGKPVTVDVAQLRRRFEAQPRVLAIMAYNTHPRAQVVLDLDELDAYQAGQTTYAALHWRRAAFGDMVVTCGRRLIEPRSASLADRLRFYAEAGSYLDSLPKHHQVMAVRLH